MLFHVIVFVVAAGVGVTAISAGTLTVGSSAAEKGASSGAALDPSDAEGQERKRFFRREDLAPRNHATITALDPAKKGAEDFIAPPKLRQSWIGTKAQIFSSSRDSWFNGRVSEVVGENIKVVFHPPGGPATTKVVPVWAPELRVSEKMAEAFGIKQDAPTRRPDVFATEAVETKTSVHQPFSAMSAFENGEKNAARRDSSEQQVSPPQVFEVIVDIGQSPIPEKCVQSSTPLACPKNAGDLDIRRNKEQTGEMFDITVSGSRTVCVKRIDKVDGWTMNLEIACNRQAAVGVRIGPNLRPVHAISLKEEEEKATKCIIVFPAVACTWNAANYGIRTDDGTSNEDATFFVESLPAGKSTSQSRVCVTRLDGDSFWDIDLQFSCNVEDHPFAYDSKMVAMRANPTKNMLCTTMEERSDMVTCPTNAAEWENLGSFVGVSYEVIVNYAFTNPDSGSRVCTRRTDMPDGWATAFNLVCASRGMITIGPSLLYYQKCITVDQPVTCAPSAANKGYRLNDDDDPGVFDVTVDGSTVCVRRSDRVEGWSMDLLIGCNPALGYMVEAKSDQGLHTVQASARRRRENWLALVEDPIESNILLDGMVVWLEHVQYKWMSCTVSECFVDRTQAPDRFRIFTEGMQANVPLMNGATVFIRHERTTMWLVCDKLCQAMSTCPSDQLYSSSNASDWSMCQNERFRIYNAAGVGPIRDGDTIWLQHSSLRYLMCPRRVDPCLVDGVCPVSGLERSFMTDGVLSQCRGERFRVYEAHIGQREKQAVEVSIGPSNTPEKCVQMDGNALTCAKNAANAPFRDKRQKTYNDDPVYEVSVKASVTVDTAWEVCVRRVDRGEGWQMNLVISCNRRVQSPKWPHDVPAFVAATNKTNQYLMPGVNPKGQNMAKKNNAKYIGSKSHTMVSEDVPVGGSIPRQIPFAPAPAGAPGPPGPPGPPGAPAPGAQAQQERKENNVQQEELLPADLQPPAPPAPMVGNGQPTAQPSATVLNDLDVQTGCWKPHIECKLPFSYNSKWYMGCVEDDALGQGAFCGLKQLPNPQEFSQDWQACNLVACDEVCWKPHQECAEPFFYQKEYHSGCIRESNQAWCSKVKHWESFNLANGDWRWCDPMDCNGACWQPSSDCVIPFTFNSIKHEGCVAHESGGAWCSFKQELTDADDDWAWCKQTSCDTVLEPTHVNRRLNQSVRSSP